jgi:hypothetical protein
MISCPEVCLTMPRPSSSPVDTSLPASGATLCSSIPGYALQLHSCIQHRVLYGYCMWLTGFTAICAWPLRSPARGREHSSSLVDAKDCTCALLQFLACEGGVHAHDYWQGELCGFDGLQVSLHSSSRSSLSTVHGQEPFLLALTHLHSRLCFAHQNLCRGREVSIQGFCAYSRIDDVTCSVS